MSTPTDDALRAAERTKPTLNTPGMTQQAIGGLRSFAGQLKRDGAGLTAAQLDHVCDLAVLYLAEHKSDDDQPADYTWLAKFFGEENVIVAGVGRLAVRICDGVQFTVPPTRGRVRMLWRALGDPLKEQP